MKKLTLTLMIVFAALFTQATAIRYQVKAMKGDTVLKEMTVGSRLEVDEAVATLSIQYPDSERIEIETVSEKPLI